MSVPSKSDYAGEITGPSPAQRIGHTTTSIKRYVTVKKKVKKKVKRKRPKSRQGSQAAGSQASQQRSEIRSEYEYEDVSAPLQSVDPSEGGPGPQGQIPESAGRRHQSQDDDDRSNQMIQAPSREDRQLSTRGSQRAQRQQMREDISRINQNARLGVAGLAQQPKTKREIMRQANIQMYRDEVRSHYLEQKQQQMLRAKKAAGMEAGALEDEEESAHERRRRELMKYQTEKAPGESIGAYFFKRKHRFLEEEKKGGFSFAKVFQAIGKSSKYVRRYFKLDTVNGTLSYAEEKHEIENKPQYQVTFGNVKGVQADVVSMPQPDGSGFQQVSTKGKSPDAKDVDMGPAGYNHPFEIYLTDRTFTLYSDNQRDVTSFVMQINEILDHKAKVLQSQKQLDQQMKEEIEIQKKRNEEQAKMYLRKLAGLPAQSIPRPQPRPSSTSAAESARQPDRRDPRESDPNDLRKEIGMRSQSAAGPQTAIDKDNRLNKAPARNEAAPRLTRRDAFRASKEESERRSESAKRPQEDAIEQRHKRIEKIMNNMESAESKETTGTKKSRASKKGTKKKRKRKKRKSKSRTGQSSKQKQLKEKYDIQSFESDSGEDEKTERLSGESVDESSSSLAPQSKSSISPSLVHHQKADQVRGSSNIPPRDPNHQAPVIRNATQHMESLNRSAAGSGVASTNFHQEISSARGSEGRRSPMDDLNHSNSGAQAQTARTGDRQDVGKKETTARNPSQTSQSQKSRRNISGASDYEERKQQIFEEVMQKRQQKRQELKKKYENQTSRSIERPPKSPRIEKDGNMSSHAVEKPPKSPRIEKVNVSAERPPKSPKLSSRQKKAQPAEPEGPEKLIDDRLKKVQEQIERLNKQKNQLVSKNTEATKAEKLEEQLKESVQRPSQEPGPQPDQVQLFEPEKVPAEPVAKQRQPLKAQEQTKPGEEQTKAISELPAPLEIAAEVKQRKEESEKLKEDLVKVEPQREAQLHDQVEVTQVQKFETPSPDDDEMVIEKAPKGHTETVKIVLSTDQEEESPESDQKIDLQQLYHRQENIVLPVFEKEAERSDIINNNDKNQKAPEPVSQSQESSVLTIRLKDESDIIKGESETPESDGALPRFHGRPEINSEQKGEPSPKRKLVIKSPLKKKAPPPKISEKEESPSNTSTKKKDKLKIKATEVKSSGAHIKLNKHKSKSQCQITLPSSSGANLNEAKGRPESDLPAQKVEAPKILQQKELVEPRRETFRAAKTPKRFVSDLQDSRKGRGDEPEAKDQHRSHSVRERPITKLQVLPVPYQPPKPLQLGDGANAEFLNGQKYSDANLMKSIFKRLEVLMVEDLEEVDEDDHDLKAGLDEVSSRDDPMLGSSSNNTATNRSMDRPVDAQREVAPVLPFKDQDDILLSNVDGEQSLAHFGSGKQPVPPLNLQALRQPQQASPQVQLCQNVKASTSKVSSRYDHPSESDFVSSKVPIEQSNLILEDYSDEDDNISPLRKAGKNPATQAKLVHHARRQQLETQAKKGENFQETFGTHSNVKFSASAMDHNGDSSIFDFHSRQQRTEHEDTPVHDYFHATDDVKRQTGYFQRQADASGSELALKANFIGSNAGGRRQPDAALRRGNDEEAQRDAQLRLLIQMGHTATAGQETKLDGAANQQNPTSRPKKTELEDIDEWDTPPTPREASSPYDDQQGGNSGDIGARHGLGNNERRKAGGTQNQRNRDQVSFPLALDAKQPSVKGSRVPGPTSPAELQQITKAQNAPFAKQVAGLGQIKQSLTAAANQDAEESSSLEDW